VSLYDNIKDWNRFSIGISLQGTNLFPYTHEQYQALTLLVNYINMRYPDSKEKPILGHSDVAYPRTRKRDPGEHFQLWRINNDITNNTPGQTETP
jgi:AmpD protein